MRARVLAVVFWMLVLFGCSGPAQHDAASFQNEATWEPLFNGKDLAGWEVVGAGEWTVEDGEIVVRRNPNQSGAGWLVTKKDYDDFKLKLKFKTRFENFNSGILVRDPGHAKIFRPAFNGYEIQIYQGQGGSERNTNGAIYDLARSYPKKMDRDAWTEFEIHCIGDHVVTFMNGEKMADVHSRRSYMGGIGLQLHGGREEVEFRWKDLDIMELPETPRDFQLLEEQLEQAPGEFVALLHGKSLEEDFEMYWEGGANWSLRDGVLRGESPEKISWIFTKASYSDFVLAFDFRINRGGNAGVCIRFPWPKDGNTSKGPAFLGYECQIEETGVTNPTGSIYELARAYTTDLWHRKIHRPEAWNHYRIYAKGDQITVYVNRRKTAETHTERSFAGRIGFQVHEPAEWVEYRNVQIKVIR